MRLPISNAPSLLRLVKSWLFLHSPQATEKICTAISRHCLSQSSAGGYPTDTERFHLADSLCSTVGEGSVNTKKDIYDVNIVNRDGKCGSIGFLSYWGNKKGINFNIKNYESSLNYRIYSITRRPRIDAALEWTPQHDAVFNRMIDSKSSQWSMLRSQMEIWTSKWTRHKFFWMYQFWCRESVSDNRYPLTSCVAVVLTCKLWNWDQYKNDFSDKH